MLHGLGATQFFESIRLIRDWIQVLRRTKTHTIHERVFLNFLSNPLSFSISPVLGCR